MQNKNDCQPCCLHRARKRDCKICCPCPHGKSKPECCECTPSRFCIHKKKKSDCRECFGGAICSHGKRERNCIECRPCAHGKLKSQCNICNGSALCPCGNNKWYCSKCKNPTIYCNHGRERRRCKECQKDGEGGIGLCEHGLQPAQCLLCGGASFCEHGLKKRRCKTCDGQDLCKTPMCTKRAIKYYDGFCFVCCSHEAPHLLKNRNIKAKEVAICEFVQGEFSDLVWVCDKTFEACSSRRPDFLCDFGSHVLVIEVDEGQHAKYDTTCENKRLMEISQDIAHRPLIMLRINPDGYVKENGQKIHSPWKFDGLGVLCLCNFNEWNLRCEKLKERINFWKVNVPEKTVELEYLFFSQKKEIVIGPQLPNYYYRKKKSLDVVIPPEKKCLHDKDKFFCSTCKHPDFWCFHGKRIIACLDCSPFKKENCCHTTSKYNCSTCCHPTTFCEHGYYIKTCNICKYLEKPKKENKKTNCKPSRMCIHEKNKYDCTICRLGTRFCVHGGNKRTCKLC